MSFGHARELGTRLDPHDRVPRCCPRSLQLLLLFQLLSRTRSGRL
ncbi:hypothetical protein [Streptomyces sediminimaris]